MYDIDVKWLWYDMPSSDYVYAAKLKNQPIITLLRDIMESPSNMSSRVEGWYFKRWFYVLQFLLEVYLSASPIHSRFSKTAYWNKMGLFSRWCMLQYEYSFNIYYLITWLLLYLFVVFVFTKLFVCFLFAFWLFIYISNETVLHLHLC